MKWSLIVCAYLGLFWLGFVENARGPIYPELLEEFSLPTSRGALFFSLASLAGLAVNLLGRFWLPALGGWRSLQVFSGLLTVSCFGIGWGAHLGFNGVLFFSLFFGFGLAGLGIAVNLLVIQGSPEQHRRRALSGLHACYGLASLISPLAISALTSLGLVWKASMQWLALGPLSLFLISLFVQRTDFSVKPTPKFSAPKRLRWLIAFTIGLYVGAEMAISSRLVLLLRQEHSYSAQDAALALSGFFALLMLGRLLMTWLSWSPGNFRMVFLSGLSSLITFALGLKVHPFFLVLTGFTMSAFFPCAMALITESHPDWADEIIATVMAALGLSVMSVHWSIGRLAQTFDIGTALNLGPALLAASLVLLWFWRPTTVSNR